MGQSKMDNPEKLATQGKQDAVKQNKNNLIYVGDHYAQTYTNNINKTLALLQTTEGNIYNVHVLSNKPEKICLDCQNIDNKFTPITL